VGSALVDDQLGPLDQRRGGASGEVDRHDLVVVAVDHQGGYVDLLQVLAEVGGRERGDRVVGVLVPALHALGPERLDQALVRRRAGAVEAVERAGRDVEVQLRAVLDRSLAQSVEHLDRQAAGVVAGPEHQRRDRGHQHRLLHPRGAVAADVADHFAAAGGEADHGDVAQVQGVDHRGQVVGVVVHVVAVPRLARAAVAAAVVGDDAVALRGQEQHLRFPAVRTQRPAVAEGDDRAVLRAPVLEIEAHAVRGNDVVAVDGGGGSGLRAGGGSQGQGAGCDGTGNGVHGVVSVQLGEGAGRIAGGGGACVVSSTGEAYSGRVAGTSGDVKS